MDLGHGDRLSPAQAQHCSHTRSAWRGVGGLLIADNVGTGCASDRFLRERRRESWIGLLSSLLDVPAVDDLRPRAPRQLVRLATGVYTTDVTSDPVAVAVRELHVIAGRMSPARPFLITWR